MGIKYLRMVVFCMFAKQLKKYRKVYGVSQAKFANEIGVSQQAVAKWETDKATPDPYMLERISKFFNISVDTLLGIKRNSESQIPINDMNQFLSQAQIIFDGNAVNLSDKDRDILEQSLKIAFMAIEKQREGGNNGNEESH